MLDNQLFTYFQASLKQERMRENGKMRRETIPGMGEGG
jgi:hypothetical protein